MGAAAPISSPGRPPPTHPRRTVTLPAKARPMSIRNLDSMFDPSSVAVIGASLRPGRVGTAAWRNLLAGGYRGAVLPVNPKYEHLDGHPVKAHVAGFAHAPDLALICTPPATVPGLIRELGAAGTRAAVVLTPGLDDAQKQAALDAARPSLLRLLGPDSIGLLAPHLGLNASAAHTQALPGALAFVSQSAGLVTAVLDWAQGRQVGFSHVVSLGERADVDFGDMLDYLASDPRTRAILLYMEAMESPRKFMSAARSAARNKPVIVVRAGRSAQGQRAAESHTRALAGSDLVFEAAISRAGMLRVDTLQDLFMAAETLARFRGNTSERLIVLTNGGGAGVMAADAAAGAGIELAELPRAVVDSLAALAPVGPQGNPLDIGGDAPVQRYVDVLTALDGAPADSATLFIHAPSALVASDDIAQALLPLAQRTPPRLLSCWLGDAAVAPARQRFRAAGVPSYFTPEEAVRAFAMGVRYRRNQEQLIEAPSSTASDLPVDTVAARALVQQALTEGRSVLTEPEAKALLSFYGIPIVPTRRVPPDPEAALAAASEVGYPVVLKVLSADIAHKSDVGGVVLNIADAEGLHSAAGTMLARVQAERPEARIEGFTVQAMVRRAHTQELIVGASIDPTFGPVILFGAGGTQVELVGDRAIGLPPLNQPLARALVERTRVARLLKGWRDTPAADGEAVQRTLVAVSRMLAELPELAELDINPLVANHEGVMALDARIRLDPAAQAGAEHFAIRPYPSHLIETVMWKGREVTLRPIRPEDEGQHREFLRRLDPEDIRMRVFYSRRSIERSELARLAQIDYGREMAFIATAPGAEREETLGVVRAMTDPDNDSAEFAIVIRSDVKSGGLGRILMNKLINYLRGQGTARVVASVLTDNRAMRNFMRSLGFVEAPIEWGNDTVDISLTL
jgi:acetyltransferase